MRILPVVAAVTAAFLVVACSSPITMYGMEVSFKVSALKNKIFISWLVVVLVLYVYKHYRHIMTGNIPYPLCARRGFFCH